MHTDPSIFKAYDVRGIYGTQITEETGYRIGRAFALFIKNKLKKTHITLVIGRDMRDSGITLSQEVIKGINEEGGKVLDIGLTSTPMMYFAVCEYGADGGLAVTASHNPAEYNGFKMVREFAIPLSGETGIYDIRDEVMNGDFSPVELTEVVQNELKSETIDLYINSVFLYQNKDVQIKPLNVVIDTANGMAGPLVQKFFSKLPGIKVTHLFPELDGTFPNHEANPLKEETLVSLKQKIAEVGADLGIACDGDFDRVSFVDNLGRTIRPDITTALLAPILLTHREGGTILYDLRSSNIVPEKIKELGGKPFMCRVGHSFIKAQMREEQAMFAGEFSGHFYLQQKIKGELAYFENPLFVALKLIELLSDSDQSLATLTDPLFKYVHSGEINFEVHDKDGTIERIKQQYNEGVVTTIDGIRIDYPEFWFSVRSSNTEPLLRLIVEGRSQSTMERVRDEIQNIISG